MSVKTATKTQHGTVCFKICELQLNFVWTGYAPSKDTIVIEIGPESLRPQPLTMCHPLSIQPMVRWNWHWLTASSLNPLVRFNAVSGNTVIQPFYLRTPLFVAVLRRIWIGDPNSLTNDRGRHMQLDETMLLRFVKSECLFSAGVILQSDTW